MLKRSKKKVSCEPSISVCDCGLLVAAPLTDPLSSKVSWTVSDENLEGPSSSSSVFAPAADGAESEWEALGTVED